MPPGTYGSVCAFRDPSASCTCSHLKVNASAFSVFCEPKVFEQPKIAAAFLPCVRGGVEGALSLVSSSLQCRSIDLFGGGVAKMVTNPVVLFVSIQRTLERCTLVLLATTGAQFHAGISGLHVYMECGWFARRGADEYALVAQVVARPVSRLDAEILHRIFPKMLAGPPDCHVSRLSS